MSDTEAQLIASLDAEEQRIIAYIDGRLSLPEEEREDEWASNMGPLQLRRREILDRAKRVARRRVITIPEEDACPTA